MRTFLPLTSAFLLSIGLLVFNTGVVAQASLQFGGNCSYCHQNEQTDVLAITNFDSFLDDLKIFDVEPGGSVDLGIDVNTLGLTDPNPMHRVVLRGLDTLNGLDESGTPHYLPLLYTPDPTWQTKSLGGEQYIFWEGQFFAKGPAFASGNYDYHLEISSEVQPGLYDLTAMVGGGFPLRMPGQTPSGGWSQGESFRLRVIPEPASLALLLGGATMFCLVSWRRKRAATVVLVTVAGLLMADVSHAYPSRSGNCAVCHSNNGPNAQTGDFEIHDAAGDPTNSYTVEAGGSTAFQFDITNLVEDHLNLETYRRGYMVVDGLDLLNVDAGAYEDIPYTASKYTIDHDQWHDGHYSYGPHRYMGPNGQYYAQSTTDPAASLPFPLTLDASVAPGTYALTAQFAGGRPEDVDYLNGWNVTKNFTLTVLPASVSMNIPEPGTFLLLACAFPAVWLSVRRRRGPQA